MNEKPRTWRIGRLAHEPLVHFLVIGAALFLLFQWRGAGGPASTRIVLTPGQIDAMAAGFARTWQRPPTERELKGLVDDYVREEMATREAMAMGLDRDDTIIRRRLRQKLEFLAEDGVDATPPTDRDLQTWLDTHPDGFRIEPEVAFRQVYFNPELHGTVLEADARRLLAQLVAAGPTAAITGLGDPLMVPGELPRSARSDVARQFGQEFADAIMAVEPGRWVGPLHSGYGMHFVWVSERQQARTPELAQVRAQVERDFVAARRTRELTAMYAAMLGRYQVTTEQRAAVPVAIAAAAGMPPGSPK